MNNKSILAHDSRQFADCASLNSISSGKACQRTPGSRPGSGWAQTGTVMRPRLSWWKTYDWAAAAIAGDVGDADGAVFCADEGPARNDSHSKEAESGRRPPQGACFAADSRSLDPRCGQRKKCTIQETVGMPRRLLLRTASARHARRRAGCGHRDVHEGSCSTEDSDPQVVTISSIGQTQRRCNPPARLLLGMVFVLANLRTVRAATCDTSCGCSQVDPLMGTCSTPTAACGFAPCTGGPDCPSGPPQSLSAKITGRGTVALNWTDPADTMMVDQYNIYYSMKEGLSACEGKSTGSTCSFVAPPGTTTVAGVCGPCGGTGCSDQIFCWLDFARYLLAIVPCTLSSPEDTSCNYQEINSGITIGETYQFKIDAGRCCYGDPNILDTPGCGACTDFDAFMTCPKSSTYSFATIAVQGFPSAVQNISVRVDGDEILLIEWLTPANTGTLSQVPSDILAYVVTRSTAADFSENLQTTTLTGAQISGNGASFRDTGLTANVVYYYRVQSRNAACGENTVCGEAATTSLRAVGVPSSPVGLSLSYLAGIPETIRGDWALPIDTGLGDGGANTDQPLTQYTLHINGAQQILVGSGLNTTFIATGLTAGTSYTFVVTASNIAGEGSAISASKIAAGRPGQVASFASSVNANDGPLKIRLSWSTPTNTGMGNQVEPITGYKILMDSSTSIGDNPTFTTTTTPYEQACTTTSACATETVVTFTTARKDPYFFRIYARNYIGYSNEFASVNEQSVALPSAPLSVSAHVTSPNTIDLSWEIAADTGVGDTSRALIKYTVLRSYGKTDMACSTICASCDACWSQIGACCSTEVSDVDNAQSLSLKVQNLPESETRFYFHITATNDAGQGTASAIVNEQGVTRDSADHRVQGLSTSIPFVLGISVAWQKPSNTGVGSSCTNDCRPLTQYRLVILQQGVQVLNSVFLPNVTSYTKSDLDHTRPYTFTVYASNSAGQSTSSASVVERPINYPTAPTSFSASVATSSPYKIALTWDTPTDTGRIKDNTAEPIVKYFLEVDLSVNDDFQESNILTLCDGTTTVCTGLTCDCVSAAPAVGTAKTATVEFQARRFEVYNFRVKAINQVGSGSTTGAEYHAYTSQQSVGVPSAVTNISASVTGILQVTLTWIRPTDTGVGEGKARSLAGYVIQRSYDDNTFSGCAYGEDTNDDSSVPAPIGACKTVQVEETTLSKMLVMPSSGPTYFHFRVLGKNEVGFGLAPTSASEQGVTVPGPVSSLDVQTIGPAMFKIDWTQVTNSGLGANNTDRPITRFQLQICRDPDRIFATIYFKQYFPGDTFTFSKYDFIGGTNYTFRVRAENDAGWGAQSASITKPAISLPSPPVDFTAVVNVPLQINLYWKFPLDTGFGDATTAPLTAYILNISISEDFSSSTEVELDPALLAYNHTGLTKATTYYFQIRSQTDAGMSLDAPNASETALSGPGTPRNFSVSVNSELVINVAWAIPSDTGLGDGASLNKLSRYELLMTSSEAAVEYSNSDLGNLSSTSFSVIATSPSVYSYAATGLQKGFRYYFQVISVNDVGKSSGTAFLQDRGLSKPLLAQNVAVNVPSPMAIHVSWDINSDSGLGPGLLPDQLLETRGIHVDISANRSDFLNASRLLLTRTHTSYTFTGLVKGMTYYFRIFSENRAGQSVSSTVVDERAIDVPSVPRFFTVQTSISVELQLDLNWLLSEDTGAGDQSNAINTYRLQEAIDAEPNTSSTNITIAGNALAYYMSNRTKGSNYFYRLFASNDAGESVATPVVNEMAIERPTVPLNLTVDWDGPMKLLIKWNLPVDTGNGANHPFPRTLLNVAMEIDATGHDFANVLYSKTFSGSTDEYSITSPDLNRGTKYYFRVRANNSAGYSPWSNHDSKTAIDLPTRPLNLVAAVTSPLEITLTWNTPSNTGGIAQSWPLLNYTVYMATNETHADEELILKANVNSFVKTGLTKAVRYFFRVYAINQAGTGPTSNSDSEEGVTLPTAPSSFTITNPAELELLVTWALPSDTGTGGQDRSLLYYILEKDDVLTSNGTFGASPFSTDVGTTCYTKAVPPCDISYKTHNNPMTESGIDLQTQRLFTQLQWGNTYYFRVFAVNSAGMGESTAIINEQALKLPSAPLGLNNNLQTENGQPIFTLTWNIPEETGAGNIARYQDPTGVITGNVRQVDNYISQAAPVEPGVSSAAANFDAPNNTVAIDPYQNSTKRDLLIGYIYYFRVAAINRVGRGPWSSTTTSGPEVHSFSPHRGPAVGAFDITVYGMRFGTSPQQISMKIGSTLCPTIKIMVDDEIFLCVAPAGTGGTHDVMVSIAGIPVVRQSQFIYEAPLVTGIVPAEISSQPRQRITIVGEHFGARDMTPTVFIQGNEGKALAACATNIWVSDSTIHCVTPEVVELAEAHNTVQVVVDGIRNSLLSETVPFFTYSDLPAFYSRCLSQPDEDCFDCVVSSCYAMETAKSVASSMAVADALDFCETTAGSFCKLDRALSQ